VTSTNWKLAIGTAVVLSVITSIPQLLLCYERGTAWNGAHAYIDPDEFVYAAYVNALMNGQPRRNDPYSAADGSQFETLFSIQFIPPYAIAIPARILHLSASQAFIILLPLVTAASSLILFIFLFEFTRDAAMSAAGAIGVLCLGMFAAQTPWESPPVPFAFPFLRRYVPAFAFPLFVALALLIWRSIMKKSKWYAAFAGLTFVILIYSYFFIWTAAACWLITLTLLWICVRPNGYRIIFGVIGIVALAAFVALVPYGWLVAHRAPGLDGTHLLEFTHRPKLFAGPEVYGAAILLGLAIFRRHLSSWRQPKFLFVLSFILTPYLLFNQQVLTGRSLQLFHYEWYIGNYLLLTGLFLALSLVRRPLPNRLPLYVATGALIIGSILSIRFAAQTLNTNIEIDRGRAAALELKGRSGVVFANRPLTHTIAATASIPVLWSEYIYVFSPADLQHRRLRFFKYLYYAAVTDQNLRVSLEHDNSVRGEIFGVDRANPILTVGSQPISTREIEEAVHEYKVFCSTFSRAEAATPMLSYAVVKADENLSNLDKWYQRDAGHNIDSFVIYRLTLKSG
jgi:hypothetical protein